MKGNWWKACRKSLLTLLNIISIFIETAWQPTFGLQSTTRQTVLYSTKTYHICHPGGLGLYCRTQHSLELGLASAPPRTRFQRTGRRTAACWWTSWVSAWCSVVFASSSLARSQHRRSLISRMRKPQIVYHTMGKFAVIAARPAQIIFIFQEKKWPQR